MPRHPKPQPMPVWLITDAPALRVASGPVYRATFILAAAYWQSGCSGLPTDPASLAAICRLPFPHLKAIEAPVNQALEQILPAMDQEHSRLVARWQAQAAGAGYAFNRWQAKQAEKRLAKAATTPYSIPTQDTAPISVVIASQQTHERKGLSDTPKQRSKPAKTPPKPADPGFTD